MSEIASQLLATYDQLPTEEQHLVLCAIMERSHSLEYGSLSDHELTSIADDLFQSLDAEEEIDGEAS